MEPLWYFKAIQGGIGVSSKKDAVVREAQRRLSFDMMDSVNCVYDATRNGKKQRFVVTPSETSYKYNVMAFPGEDLFTGDLLEFNGRHWMVVEMPSSPVMQFSGVVWECNHLFRFQTFDGSIVERWGVIDSGQYSSDVYNGTMLSDTNSQYRLYMQLDDQTNQIFIDKRLAIAKIFDQKGKQILDVYKVTDVDPVTQSYGGGHLLALRAVSDAYDPTKDSIDHMICDYIDENFGDQDNDNLFTIVGPETIRSGFARTYTASKLDSLGNPISQEYFVWSVECSESGVSIEQTKTGAILHIAKNTPIGANVVLRSIYSVDKTTAEKRVKVVGIL